MQNWKSQLQRVLFGIESKRCSFQGLCCAGVEGWACQALPQCWAGCWPGKGSTAHQNDSAHDHHIRPAGCRKAVHDTQQLCHQGCQCQEVILPSLLEEGGRLLYFRQKWSCSLWMLIHECQKLIDQGKDAEDENELCSFWRRSSQNMTYWPGQCFYCPPLCQRTSSHPARSPAGHCFGLLYLKLQLSIQCNTADQILLKMLQGDFWMP